MATPEASKAIALVEARLATAMELLTSAMRDIALMRRGQLPQQQQVIHPAASNEEQEHALPSPEHGKLLEMIRARKTGQALGDIHTWANSALDWDETTTNDALTDLVEGGHIEEPTILQQGVTYVAVRKVERHIESIDPKLLMAIMDALVSAMPLERVRDMLSTFSEGWTISQVRTALGALRTDGYVQMIGSRRNARWEKVADLPEVYARNVQREEQFQDEPYHVPAQRVEQAPARSAHDDDFAIDDTPPHAIDRHEPREPEEEDDELLVVDHHPTAARAVAKTKTPSTERDWESLMLDALEDNHGTMDFEELVTHCQQYGGRYSFNTATMARDVIFNGLSRALQRLSVDDKVRQDGQDIALVETFSEEEDDEDGQEDGIGRSSVSLIRQAALEQPQILPKPPKKGGRHKPVTLTDWVWLVYDMIIWANDDHRRSLSIAGIAINLAKEPAEVQWTIADMRHEEVVRNIRVAIPFVMHHCPDVEETRDGNRKKYGIISD